MSDATMCRADFLVEMDPVEETKFVKSTRSPDRDQWTADFATSAIPSRGMHSRR
jgi:hypothetical protein